MMTPWATTWLDITDTFTTASALLGPGELVMDSAFSLFDAMSAIEISDPKMDAIVQWSRYPRYPRSVKEAAGHGQLKLSAHSPPELIGIFDEMLACIATWLKGHTLAQTVFTSLYLLDTTLVEDPILHSMSVALIRIVEIVRDIIARAGVYAEDDQQIVCVGFNMLPLVRDEDVLGFIKTAKDHLMTVLRNLPPEDNPSGESFSTVNWTRPLISAVLHRIKYLRSFFIVVSSFNKRSREGIVTSRQEISECESSLTRILSTQSLGQELDPGNPLLLGFHPLINQHLLPPSYRPYGIMSRETSVALFQNLLKELHLVYTFGGLNTLGDLFKAVRGLSTYEHSPNVLTRSLITKLCFQNERSKLFSSKPMETMIRDDIRYLFNPPAANPRSPLSTSPQAQELVDRFLTRAYLPFVDLLTVYCQHRARQRIIIAKYMDTVGDVQLESEALDTQLGELILRLDPQRQVQGGGGCYSTWLVYYITQLFIDFLLLGFEYRLYSPYEAHYVFWYLEYMYGWEQMSLKTAGKIFVSEPQPAASGKNKKRGKAKKKELPKERELEINYLQIKRIVCIGLMRAYEALMLEDKTPKPSFEFGSEALVFRHRFLPFLMVTSPQPLSYEDYKQLAGIENYKGQSINLFEAASQHFQTAKTTLEALRLQDEDSKQLLKVVKTNLVIMNLALRGHKKDSKTPPTLDFTEHRAFPVIRIN